MRAITAFILTVTGLALFSLAKPLLDSRLSQVRQVQLQYQQAVLNTYQSLTTVAYEILDETNLKQNLEWDLNRSNEGILRRYLYPGRISFLRVLTKDCQLVSHSEGGVIQGSPCHSIQTSTIEQPAFHWLSPADKPLVALTMPFSSGTESYVLYIGTYLDHAWFHHHPKMDALRQSINLKVANSDNSALLLHREGFSQDSYHANLYSKDWLLSSLPFLIRLKPNALNQVVFYLGFLTLILLAAVTVLLRRQESRLIQSLQEFSSWVCNLAQKATPDQEISSRQDPKVYLDNMREGIKQLHDFHFHRDRDLKLKIDQQKAKFQILERDFLVLQEKYTMAQRLETLYSQFQQTSSGFVRLQEQIMDQTENLSDVLSHGLSRKATELYELVQRWDHELSLMSARKFVRSLAERPSRDQPGKSELESDVNRLVEMGKNLSQYSIHLSIEVQKILHQLNQGLQVVQHWGSLKDQQAFQGRHLGSIILEAQNLVPMTTNIPDHQFVNLYDGKLDIQSLTLPKSIWVSILYHLYLNLIEQARQMDSQAIRIQSRTRLKEGQVALVLTLECSLDAKLDNERAQNHLALVKQLIRPYPVQVIELPRLHDSISLALTWQQVAETLTVEGRRIRGGSRQAPDQQEL